MEYHQVVMEEVVSELLLQDQEGVEEEVDHHLREEGEVVVGEDPRELEGVGEEVEARPQ